MKRLGADHLEGLVTGALVLLAMVALVVHVSYLSVKLVDDAAISLAYGINLFSGHGFRLTPNSQIVEGFSNPLWTLLLGAAAQVSEPLRAPRVLGTGCGVLALPVFAVWGPAAMGRRLQLQDSIGALGAAALPLYAFWIGSGMEVGLFALLIAGSGALLLKELRTGRGCLTGVALALLCLTRPEGVLFAFAGAAVWLAHLTLQRRFPGRQEAAILSSLTLLLGAYLVFRWGYFASVLPNTYYAKLMLELNPGAYFSHFYEAHTWMAWAAAAGVLCAFGGGKGGALPGGLAALFLACLAYFTWFSKGDWMREWRFFAPGAPLLPVALAAGLSGLRQRWDALFPPPWPRLARVAGHAALLGIGAAALFLHCREVRGRIDPLRSGELPFEFIAQASVSPVKEKVRFAGEVRPRVGLADIGALGLIWPEAEVIDVAMLADYALAHHNPNRRAQEDYLLHDAMPTTIDIHGPTGHLIEFRTLVSQYRPLHGPIRILDGLGPETDPRCPRPKQEVRQMEVAQLAEAIDQTVERGAPLEALKLWRCAVSYRSEAALPVREWRQAMSHRLLRVGEDAAKRGQLEAAVRYHSLATHLLNQPTHLRRKTELLRAALFRAAADR